MKKLALIIFSLVFNSITAQQLGSVFEENNPKILKVSYTAYPISSYDTPPESSQNFKNHSQMVSLAQSYEHKYSLYVNLETNESIYKLDTLVVNKKEGQENMNFMINSNLDFVVKEKNGNVYKYEQIFQREFYSEGNLNNIEWKLTDETKTISGMKCRKAIAKDEDLLLNVWFTEKIPISNGPVNYFGLPGLVVWSEDFFWTTEITNIEYINDFDFESLRKNLVEQFNKSKKGKEIKESLLIVKKNALVKSMIEQMK
ncbi:GLPGLI family protein [Psychroflexus sp. MBR-150]|jgi:GLPGLI family protein